MSTAEAILSKLSRRQDLSHEESLGFMQSVMDGSWSDARVGAALMALNLKGVSVTELAAFAELARSAAVRIAPRVTPLVDTCGTGGDGSRTFNISTSAAFVVAACGVSVAKHGNRSVSSRCGSADVLEQLGVNIQVSPERVRRCIETVGIGFLFAPQHHPSFRRVGEIRRELGIRTVFNLLGPLLNPAGVSAQLIGVYDPSLTDLFAQTLSRLGLREAMVVHGDGLDELTLSGPNRISWLHGGRIRTFSLTAAEAGLAAAPREALAVAGPAESAAVVRAVLGGERGSARDVVLLNAAAGLLIGGGAPSFAEGVALAAAAVDSGRAGEKLEALRRFSHDPGPDCRA
jgi:anthranilate phosphoribosyltransferase